MTTTVPKAKSVFRPRADAGVLSALVQAAWREYEATNLPSEERASVAAAVAEHIKGLYPLSDMEVLARYGCASPETHVSVRVHDGKDWAQVFGLELPEPILVARNYNSMSYYSGGPWFSRDPMRGVTAKYRASLSEQKWKEFCDDQDATDRARIPEELEPYFNRLLAARTLVHAEYRTAVNWPAEFKTKNGRFPTWMEIADQFLVLGGHLRSLWNAERVA